MIANIKIFDNATEKFILHPVKVTRIFQWEGFTFFVHHPYISKSRNFQVTEWETGVYLSWSVSKNIAGAISGAKKELEYYGKEKFKEKQTKLLESFRANEPYTGVKP